MNNEFTDNFGSRGGWGCPCDRMPGGCLNTAPQGAGALRPEFAGRGNVCQMAHRDITYYYDVPPWNKWRAPFAFFRSFLSVVCILHKRQMLSAAAGCVHAIADADSLAMALLGFEPHLFTLRSLPLASLTPPRLPVDAHNTRTTGTRVSFRSSAGPSGTDSSFTSPSRSRRRGCSRSATRGRGGGERGRAGSQRVRGWVSVSVDLRPPARRRMSMGQAACRAGPACGARGGQRRH